MKKFVKRTLIAALAAVTAVGACGALVACKDNGTTETPAANMTGCYGSSTFTFMSAYPAYTFKQVTSSVQNLTTYDDNTYMLTVTTKSISGALSFDPKENGTQTTEGTNDRGESYIVYYGTYTSTNEEGLLTFTLSAPTDIVECVTGNVAAGAAGYFVNTKAWTQKMTEAFVTNDDADGKTRDEYIADKTFKSTSVTVDSSTNGFTFIQLSK